MEGIDLFLRIIFIWIPLIFLVSVLINIVLEIIHSCSLYLVMKKQNKQQPFLAFIPIAKNFSEGSVINDILKFDGWKSDLCKFTYLFSAFTSGISVNIMSAFKVNPFDNIFDASYLNLSSITLAESINFRAILIPLLIIISIPSIISFSLSIYMMVTKFLALNHVGYGAVSSVIIVFLLQPFYLFFINNKLQIINEDIIDLDKNNEINIEQEVLEEENVNNEIKDKTEL